MDKSIRSLTDEFPMSITKNKCIGPCYPANTPILHPITLQLTSNSKPFCPIQPLLNKFQASTQQQLLHGRAQIIDECSKITSTGQYEQNFITPKIEFDTTKFLILYYSIQSLDDAVIWYNNNASVPYNTIKRIMDCALKIYGIEELQEKPATDFMIEFTKFMILEYWFDKYLIKFASLITLTETKTDQYSIQLITNLEDNESKIHSFNKSQKLFMKHTIESLLTTLLIRRILKKYCEYYKDQWQTMDNHLSKLSKIAFYFIRKKMLQLK